MSQPFSTVLLRDGNRVGVLEVGQPDGIPLFHMHGSGSSRLEVLPLASTATRLGVRLIGLDRPGVGLSDPGNSHSILNWPEVVEEVADRLGIERFAVEGVSAGGPYALACACKIPHRLISCGLIGTLSPPELMRRAAPFFLRMIWEAGSRFPGIFAAYLRIAVSDSATSVAAMERRIRGWKLLMADSDRNLFKDQSALESLACALAENLRQGARAARNEALIGIKPWGFKPADVDFQPVFLWHGERDRIMPAMPARLLAGELPHCQATFYPLDGHFSVLIDHLEEIFLELSRGRTL
jgi:pimeloyl-ACP methyl ester carboxylesterase